MNIKAGEHFLKTRHVLLIVLRDQEYFRKTRHILFLVSGDQLLRKTLLKDQAYTTPSLEEAFYFLERPGMLLVFLGDQLLL